MGGMGVMKKMAWSLKSGSRLRRLLFIISILPMLPIIPISPHRTFLLSMPNPAHRMVP